MVKKLIWHKRTIVVACFLLAGLVAVVVSRAAGVVTSYEAEAGTVTGKAAEITASTASGGSAVQFGSAPVGTGRWQPALNTPWMWLLAKPLNLNNASDMGTGVKNFQGAAAPDPVVYNIDGFDNPASTIAALHQRGLKAICYITAGSSEDWRPDYGDFPASVKGNPLDGWQGERWLDIRNITVLGPIMQARLDMCKQKGFDAVEFDNVDGYSNDTGFPLNGSHQVAYNTSLARWAQERGLSAALKNNVEQIPQLWQAFDFAINEECNVYDECDNYSRYFIANGKAVFQVEYEGSTSSFCPAMNSANINSLRLPLNLDGGRQPCR